MKPLLVAERMPLRLYVIIRFGVTCQLDFLALSCMAKSRLQKYEIHLNSGKSRKFARCKAAAFPGEGGDSGDVKAEKYKQIAMKIGKDTMVTLEYTLRYDGPEGQIIEEYTEDDPTEVLVGRGLLLDVLEKNLLDLEPGDGFDFLIDEDQGYGPYDEEKVVQFPESELMAQVPENERVSLKVGEFVPIQDMEGKHYEALVMDKQDGMVTLDFNEPLAGETLHFRGRVLEVRRASDEELKQALEE